MKLGIQKSVALFFARLRFQQDCGRIHWIVDAASWGKGDTGQTRG
jgi:hypothetical protein